MPIQIKNARTHLHYTVFSSLSLKFYLYIYRKLITDPKTGENLKEGDLLVNKELAATMRKIQKNAEDFYTGELAKKIVDDVSKAKGKF